MRDTWGKFLTIVRFILHTKVRKMVALVPLVLSFDSLLSHLGPVPRKPRTFIATAKPFLINLYLKLYNNKINAGALIGQSAMVYCTGKPMEKSRVF